MGYYPLSRAQVSKCMQHFMTVILTEATTTAITTTSYIFATPVCMHTCVCVCVCGGCAYACLCDCVWLI